MTPTMKKKTPVAGQGNEGNESIAERSVTTAYLARWGHNTRDTFHILGDVLDVEHMEGEP